MTAPPFDPCNMAHVALLAASNSTPITAPGDPPRPTNWERLAAAALRFAGSVEPAPVPMRLRCPRCDRLHVDKGAFSTRPHHTHACQFCGEVWRPALVATVGVRFLPGFRDEPDSAALGGQP